jgi:hypothetical protein
LRPHVRTIKYKRTVSLGSRLQRDLRAFHAAAYKLAASSRESTSAFFAKFCARGRSPSRMASRAVSMKLRAFDSRSFCAGFKDLPCVRVKFPSAASKLCCVSAFAATICSGLNSGRISVSAGFSAAEGLDGGVATRGLGGVRTAPSEGSGAGWYRMSGGLSGSASIELTGSTGCANETFTTCAVGRFSPKQPPSSRAKAQVHGTKIIRRFLSLFAKLHCGRLSMLRPRSAVRFETSCRGQPPM